MVLPEGKVTFLLTDVEGSTRRWDEQPERMRELLERHDQLLTSEIRRHAGVVVKSKGEGDSLFAVFKEARSALEAASAIQQALLHASDDQRDLKVRIAMHTGNAQLRERDYFGSTVNRCARLRAAAHGGQVLLTHTTRDEVQGVLPEGVTLRALGQHRLKDLSEPEQVFQLLHSNLPQDFPPLRTVENTPHNLPHQLNRFVGRVEQRAHLRGLLGENRLVCLVGAGGVGKTRLAIQVGRELLGDFPDGVWLVELAPLANPELLPRRAAAALGVTEEGSRPILETLIDYLRSRNLLLVLDNCEHLVKASAELVEAVLHAGPAVRVLATSRETLGITGELAWRVPSLSLPDRTGVPPPGSSTSEAVVLFAERGASASAAFRLDDRTSPLVAQVCRRLDGIPLALELAAAKLRVLTLSQLAERLDDRFRLLTGGSRTSLPRQQTLRATIDWSYSLLSEAERTMMRRLSVFAGGITLGAVEAVCVGGSVQLEDVLELLNALLTKSILVADEDSEPRRYLILETIRQYAREKLREGVGGASEAGSVRLAHRNWCLDLAQSAGYGAVATHPEAIRIDLELEQDNLRAALDSAAEDEDAGSYLRLATALGPFWEQTGNIAEGLARLQFGLSLEGASLAKLRARARMWTGLLWLSAGDFRNSRAHSEASLEQSRCFDDKFGIAQSLFQLGIAARHLGQLKQGARLGRESLALFRRMGNQRGEGLALCELGVNAGELGLVDEARRLCRESVDLCHRIGYAVGEADALLELAGAEERAGNLQDAEAFNARSVAIFRKLGRTAELPGALAWLARIVLFRGDAKRAATLAHEGLALAQALGETYYLPTALRVVGLVATSQGNFEEARRSLAAALMFYWDRGQEDRVPECLRGYVELASAQQDFIRVAKLAGSEAVQRSRFALPLYPPEASALALSLQKTRQTLGEKEYDIAWGEGKAMSLAEAVSCALLSRVIDPQDASPRAL